MTKENGNGKKKKSKSRITGGIARTRTTQGKLGSAFAVVGQEQHQQLTALLVRGGDRFGLRLATGSIGR